METSKETSLLDYFRKLYEWPKRLAVSLLMLKNSFYLFLATLILLPFFIAYALLCLIILSFVLIPLVFSSWDGQDAIDTITMPPLFIVIPLFFICIVLPLSIILVSPLIIIAPLTFISDYLTGSKQRQRINQEGNSALFNWRVGDKISGQLKFAALLPHYRLFFSLLGKLAAYGIPLAWLFSGLLSLAIPYPLAIGMIAVLAVYLLTEAYADSGPGGLAETKRSLFFDQLSLWLGIKWKFRGYINPEFSGRDSEEAIDEKMGRLPKFWRPLVNGDLETILKDARKESEENSEENDEVDEKMGNNARKENGADNEATEGDVNADFRFWHTNSLIKKLDPGLGLSHLLGLGIGISLSVLIIPLAIPSIIAMGIPSAIAVFSACMLGVLLYKISKDLVFFVLQIPFDISTIFAHFTSNQLRYLLKFLAFCGSIYLATGLFPMAMTALIPLALPHAIAVLIALLIASLPLSIVNHLSKKIPLEPPKQNKTPSTEATALTSQTQEEDASLGEKKYWIL